MIKKSLFIGLLAISIACSNEKRTADPVSTDEFTFVFMTDIHLQPELRGKEGFIAAIDSVNILKPDFVITGGDLIMDALEESYERVDQLYSLYTETISKFNMPVYNTMGNHEIFGIYKTSGISPDHPEYGQKMYEKRIGKRYYSFRKNGWLFLILDSVEDNGDGQYLGKIDSEQLEWIKSVLDTTDPGTPIAISLHIPLCTSFLQVNYGPLECNSETLVVTNALELINLFRDHSLKLVLQGHTHFLEDILSNGIHYISGGAVCAKWWQGPNHGLEEGFLVVHVKGRKFTWEYFDYGWKAI